MTTYNLSGNLRDSGNDSATQNVGTFDTVVITLSTHYGLTVESQSNIGSVSLVGGSSFNSTVTATVTFFAAGSYSLVLKQGYYNRTYTLTGTASGSTNYGYGLHVYDANGNIRMDMSRRQPRIVGFVSGNRSSAKYSFTQNFPGYNGSSSDNRGDEWYALSLEPNSNYYVNDTGAFGSFTIERADVRTSDNSYQILSGSEDYRMVIIRM